MKPDATEQGNSCESAAPSVRSVGLRNHRRVLAMIDDRLVDLFHLVRPHNRSRSTYRFDIQQVSFKPHLELRAVEPFAGKNIVLLSQNGKMGEQPVPEPENGAASHRVCSRTSKEYNVEIATWSMSFAGRRFSQETIPRPAITL